MADNLLYTPGTGASVATDDIAGIHFQRVKIVIGADGVNGGDVSASNTLPVSGTVTANAGTGTLSTDPTDRAARDMGKIDIALLDQYTPIDVDSGVGIVNALPITWRKSSALGVEFGTATDPVRTDPTGTTTQPVSGTFFQATVEPFANRRRCDPGTPGNQKSA